MDNRTAQHAGASYQPTRSILKPSRSSHVHPNTRLISRSPPSHPNRAVQIADPPTRAQTQTQAIRSIAAIPQHGPIPEMTITFPAVHNAEELEQFEKLVSELAGQIQARRKELASNPMKKVQLGRPTYSPDDYPEFRDILMDPWQAGADYGPVLRPRDAMKLHQPLRINPHVYTTGDRPLVRWDVTQPPTSAVMIHPDGRIMTFEEFRHEPATSPRITQVKIISRLMPWDWLVYSKNKMLGVTIGDLFMGLSVVLPHRLGEWDMNRLDEEKKTAAINNHRARCSDKESKGPVIYDLLSGNTMFGGFVYDPVYERERNFFDRDTELNILVSYLPITNQIAT